MQAGPYFALALCQCRFLQCYQCARIGEWCAGYCRCGLSESKCLDHLDANVTVTLVAGTNTIQLETTVAAGFANIDWIEITGNNPAETACSGAVGSRIAVLENAKTSLPLVDEAPVVFPNPGNCQSSLKLTLSTQQKILANMYAPDGRMVEQFANRIFAPGIHLLPVDAKGLKPGVYFISVNNGTKTNMVQQLIVQ